MTTEIDAPIERCFDLARDIDAHSASASRSQEVAIAGRTHGLIGIGETVTFRARHFGLQLTHTSKITACEPPAYFQDSMLQGVFKSFVHDHRFTIEGARTIMTDVIEFEAPLGWLGRIVARLLIRPHLRRFLEERNAYLKRMAEASSDI